MRSLLAGGLRPGFWVFLLLTQSALAQQPFPYQAVVDVPQLEVRSGPGGRYYPTSHLKKGDLVTVHRHDPGGWYMIAPPGGSFSWVQASDVQQDSPTHGVVIRSDVMVRVGSLIDDHKEVEQRRLNTGEEVTIIGQETWKTDTGDVKVLQIAPPKGEYRWAMGSSLIPVSELPQYQVASAQPAPMPQPAPAKTPEPVKAFASVNEVTPDSKPPLAFESVSTTEEPPALSPQPMPTPEPPAQFLPPVTSTASPVTEGAETAWRRNVPPEEFRQEVRQHLAELDQAFGEMVQLDVAEWNFQELEAAYVELEKQAQSKAISSIVDFRMQAIERYRQRIREYQEFTRVANETTRRDQELAMQQQTLPGSESPPAEDVSGLVNAEDESPAPRPIQPVSSAKPVPQPESASPAPLTAPQPERPAGPPKFDGAGVVGRLSTPKPNGAEYVLMSPDGRVLAYLQGEPGLDLSAYSGQSLGIIGQRAYDESLQADLIFVHDVQPVKLRR